MDGNGRWAELRGRDRALGHLKGARAAKAMIETCAEMGIPQLTLYTFSTENWLRPKSEVSFLMHLLSRHLKRERANLVKNNIRFTVVGDVSRLPASVQAEVDATIAATHRCTGMLLTFALSYGSRQEITTAARTLVQDVLAGRLKLEDIDEQALDERLQTKEQFDPDLIIRTSGEFRLSNFMLWQAAYSEIYVTKTLWPDFDRHELDFALAEYARRERRFGKTAEQTLTARAKANDDLDMK